MLLGQRSIVKASISAPRRTSSKGTRCRGVKGSTNKCAQARGMWSQQLGAGPCSQKLGLALGPGPITAQRCTDKYS